MFRKEGTMNYIEIDIETNTAGVEIVVGKLLTLGITDTVVDDPHDAISLLEKKEDYEWDYIEDDVINDMDRTPKVTVYLEDSDENRALADRIEDAMVDLMEDVRAGKFGDGTDVGTLKVSIFYDDDTTWKDKWKEYFKPSKISDSIVVKPTWEEYEKKDGEKVIEIDPGMAFGTGTHETTSMCVKMLEKYVKQGDDVLDVGCGSGILSIAAALLGAKDVLAIDIDPIAVQVADENIRLNKADKVARAKHGDLTKGVDYKADVVVANLMADLVMMLSKDVSKHMKDGGKFISSGILTDKEDTVRAALEKDGFSIVEVIHDGEWSCIVGEIK